MKVLSYLISASLFLSLPSSGLTASDDIAAITSVSGTATIKRPGVADLIVAVKGSSLRVADEVRTADGGKCQITMKDDSFINLGPKSVVHINQYTFNEQSGRRTAVIQLIHGFCRIVIYKVRTMDSIFRVEAEPASIFVDGFADIAIHVSAENADAAVLQGGLRMRNRLPYIVGEAWLKENQRATISGKAPPSSPGILTERERQGILRTGSGS